MYKLVLCKNEVLVGLQRVNMDWKQRLNRNFNQITGFNFLWTHFLRSKEGIYDTLMNLLLTEDVMCE